MHGFAIVVSNNSCDGESEMSPNNLFGCLGSPNAELGVHAIAGWFLPTETARRTHRRTRNEERLPHGGADSKTRSPLNVILPISFTPSKNFHLLVHTPVRALSDLMLSDSIKA